MNQDNNVTKQTDVINLIDTTADVVQDQLDLALHFTVPIYTIEKPEFLDVAREVSKEFIAKRKDEIDLNPIYPVYQTESLNLDPRMLDFADYIAQTAWNILDAQGYDVQNLTTYFESMWCQEHHKHSAMEQHIHGNGVQMVGFYFLDTPEGSSKVVLHDPRPGKVQLDLRETDTREVTIASNAINITPKPGMLLFTNAWLAHSFSRCASTEPMRFIHFNVAVRPAEQVCPTSSELPAAEVI